MTARIWLSGRERWIQILRRKALTRFVSSQIAVWRAGSKTEDGTNLEEKNYDNINSNFHSYINHENPAADLAEQPCSSRTASRRRPSGSRPCCASQARASSSRSHAAVHRCQQYRPGLHSTVWLCQRSGPWRHGHSLSQSGVGG